MLARTTSIPLLVALWLAGCGPTADAPSGAAGDPIAYGPGSGVNDPRHRGAPYVLLLSLDGFRHDYLDRVPTPVLQAIAREGVRADRLIPTYPTKTFPAHYSMATGLYAENHGLVGNRFRDPERGALYQLSDREAVEDGTWYRGEPIWVTAERQGMRTAAYHFVGTEGDVGGVRPTRWYRYHDDVTRDQRVDSVLAWLALPESERPHLITFYFPDLDHVGHDHGPESPEVARAIEAVDASLGRLIDGIDALPHGDRVYLVVVSDHGMLRVDPERAQRLDLSVFPGVTMVERGPYASLWVDEGGPARLPALRDSIQARLPEARVYLRADVPERFHYSADPRIGDLVVMAEPGAEIVSGDWSPGRERFTHGWDNQAPGMGAVFLARGPRIAPGQRIPAFESVHLYPFLAHLLGLEPAEVDGSLEVLAPILSGG